MRQEAAIGLIWAALAVVLAAFGLVLPAVAVVVLGVLALGFAGLRLLATQSGIEARLVDLEARMASVANRPAAAPAAKPAPDTGALLARLNGLTTRLEVLEAQRASPPTTPPPAVAEPRAEPTPPSQPDQPELPILEPPGDVELSRAQVVRALNFPENAGDDVGFALMRRALARRDLAELLQAAEDCLNYLSQQLLYMDDLLMEPAGAEDWRAFAKGGRSRAALLPIQGIRDEAAAATVQKRMRSDAVFRDTALVFQRRFDMFLGDFAKEASDAELLGLMDTRTGRAFILFAQVSGSLAA
ncbi:hypothetical protein [Algicella marina]|uniref:Uncharacterized protein n=1 Tax=Algicella marina TaxID=2683284 RepID=A0A6P1T6C1_9RHOB|nr:hypothetical protein [Algicella marina]QHQ37016.1 hypothetical protein GO499_18420 [Algicella marina]